MERLKKISADAVFVIQILVVFVLLFEERIVVPAVLQSFGRMHPLLLHLPIGLLLITVVLIYTYEYSDGAAKSLMDLLLHLTALTASLTTLMGMFLSLEGGFSQEQIVVHKWLGVALSFLCWGLLALKNNLRYLKVAGATGALLVVFTGHYGANLTHGEDFVWAPLLQEDVRAPRVITDSSTFFSAAIEPVLETKCYGCHNEKKAKGDLVLTSIEGILRGGEAGPLWKANDAENSLIVERLLLPLDHDDHMPPKDKAQPGADEIALISLWIDGGADLNTKLREVPANDTLGVLASIIVPRYQQLVTDQPKYTFRFASPQKIQELSKPNRSVFQIARNEPAIQADFFLREAYTPRDIEELLEVKEQLVSLSLSRMPVQDSHLQTIARFSNLEVLNLNYTGVTGSGLRELSALQNLKSLSVSGTAIEAADVRHLADNSQLKEVFIWNTGVTPEEVESLKKEFPSVDWHVGFIPDETELLKLNPPMLRNKATILNQGEKLVLRHNLPGTEMRYTVDGSEPDSLQSAVFSDSIAVKHYATIKSRAFKDGWLSSDVAEFFIFRKGFHPDSARLEMSPDERFPGEGTMTLLDGKQGLADFYRHPAWMAFKENDLVLSFSFERQVPTITNVTLSFAHNNWYACVPPDEVQLWGGDDRDDLRLLARLNPPEAPRPSKARIEGISMQVPASNYKHYKFVAKPTRSLADGNPNKRTLWLMVDEVFIN